MNPGYKYPIDENVLRSKLLENSSSNVEQAWEKFELYLSQQKPIFTESKKTRLALMIPPKLLFRGFLACLIILPSLLFYRQFNTQIPAAINKAYASSAVSKKEPKAIQKPIIITDLLNPAQSSELNSQPELLKQNPLSLVSEKQTLKESPKRRVLLPASGHQDTTSKNSAVQLAIPNASANTIPVPTDKVISSQTEQSGELNEQL
jgi:hypothetical protein